MRFHGALLQVELEGGRLTVAHDSDGPPVEVRVGDVAEKIESGENRTFDFRGT